MKFSAFRLLALLAAGALAAPALAAPPVHDELLAYGNRHLTRAALPAGPAGAPVATQTDLGRIYAFDSGNVLTITPAPGPQANIVLNELYSNGSLRFIGVADLADPYRHHEVLDMARDHRFRFFLLVRSTSALVSGTVTRLVQIDPSNAAVLSQKIAPGIKALAPAPEGLWALRENEVVKLDPDTLESGPAVADLSFYSFVSDLDADSSGRLYFGFEPVCSPPCPMIGTFDPAGGPITTLPGALHNGVGGLSAFAIDRRCTDSLYSRCLQGGRFRAEIAFHAYDGAAGPATAAAARSRDTGVFSFFDASNWELMVKVLDGCAINGHFWVYAAASTDVEYQMTITDTQTGAKKVYSNGLGQVAETVTDGMAFSCEP